MAVGIESNSRPVFDVPATRRSDGAAATARAEGFVLINPTSGEPAGAIASTGTQSNVSAATSSTTLLAANAARKGATIWNDSTSILYVLLSAQTASAALCTAKLIADAYYEVPAGYAGIVKGIWVSATGAARVTELV